MNLVKKLNTYFITFHYFIFILGRKVKRLESQMRQKDIHYRLKWFEDDKMIRDQVKRETITTLRDSESRHYD